MFNKIKQTKEPKSQQAAYDYAIFLLSDRLRTSGELSEKLKLKGFETEVINKLIQDLTKSKYLDDNRFAEIFLDNLKKYKNFGFYGIKKKLLEKRLPNSIIESILSAGLSLEDEIKIAKRFLNSQKISIANKSSTLEKQKLAQKLKGRGFRGEVISKLVF